ncbi:hypothetical protein AVEN_63425-1 [Araneus ventricosus]|uniref:Uncharacterized protein n=1 Tax=Araneus ventricosus TaxID=182803 RepID=A0A4Y2W486_ARAVE|nr:hypothetical protein AVEN_63425-1 [Araneus ventricosus]
MVSLKKQTLFDICHADKDSNRISSRGFVYIVQATGNLEPYFVMKTALVLCAVALLSATMAYAKMAEKVSEDDDFVVYRIPVRDLDLQSQASRMSYDGGLEYGGSHGRSSSKSSSSSKSTSSSTGAGRGKGYGEGSSSAGHGTGHGGSSSGHGYGGSSGGYGSGHGGSGYGSGGSGGSGYGSGGSGYGSGGTGYGSGGSGHGSGGSGYGSGGSGYGSGGSGYGRGGSGHGYGSSEGGYGQGGQASYTPGGYEPHHSTSHNHYDEDEGDHPKIVTTTKTVSTNSAHDTGLNSAPQYRQIPDSVGDLHFRLADYLKIAPGHEASTKYNQKLFEGYGAELSEAAPAFRSGQHLNVNAFTRSLNQNMGAFKAPSYRSNGYVPQASVIYPTAYALRHVGFGLGGF